VIEVEWNSLFQYPQSVSDTRSVGAEIAYIAENVLVAKGKLPRKYLYCVGHSLGAHVCGFAGLKYTFHRITGRLQSLISSKMIH